MSAEGSSAGPPAGSADTGAWEDVPRARAARDGAAPGALPRAAARPRRSPEHFAVLGVAGLVLVGLCVLGLWLVPDPSGHGTHRQLGMPPCMMIELWNVPCPGCGVTTSVTLATQGHLVDAFRNQPFGLLVFLGLASFVLWSIWAQLTGRDLWVWLHTLRFGRWGIAIGAVAGVSWVYKIWLVRSGAG